MATNYLELATTLKNIGAKWLQEKELISHPEFVGWNPTRTSGFWLVAEQWEMSKSN